MIGSTAPAIASAGLAVAEALSQQVWAKKNARQKALQLNASDLLSGFSGGCE